MAADGSTQHLLEALVADIRKTNPEDLDGIARVGAALEAAADGVPAGRDGAAGLLRQALDALEALYHGHVAAPSAAIDAICGAVEAAAAQCQPDAGLEAPAPDEAAAALRSALQADTGASPDHLTGTEPAPAGVGEDTSLDDAAALLVSADPDDREELDRLARVLTHLLDDGALPGEARNQVAAARDAIERAVRGEESEPEIVLAESGQALEHAMRACEKAELEEDSAETADEEVLPVVSAAPQPDEAREEGPGASDDAPPEEVPEENEAAPAILPADTDTELLREYVVESLDHIGAAEASLLELETDPDQSEPIHTVFRAFHTIKGTSGFLGLDHIQTLAHWAETLLDRAREGEIRLTGGYADLALESCDTLKALLEGLEGVESGSALPLPLHYADLLGRLADPEGAGITAAVAEESPVVPRVGDILVVKGQAERDDVEAAARDKGQTPIGEALVKFGAASAPAVAKALRTQRQMAKPATSEGTVRIGTDRLDALMNTVGELVIAHSMIAQNPHVVERRDPRFSRDVGHAGKIVRELQDLAMALRMVPLKATFRKMARLVRDLGRKSGKSVQFVTEGDETEIDRNIVQVLNDPLVHMIRNAVDHGIESAEDRRAAGKAATGTVCLRACHSAGNVVIQLTDDGKGLDRDRIVAKAVERGLADAGQDLTDGEVYSLIFQPGFSTAEKVTDVSGRGVGMDVVKRGIKALRGRVDVASTLGAGSRFTMRLPLTMAIADAMLLKIGAERYLLPTVSIRTEFPARAGQHLHVRRGQLVGGAGRLLGRQPLRRQRRRRRRRRVGVERDDVGFYVSVDQMLCRDMGATDCSQSVPQRVDAPVDKQPMAPWTRPFRCDAPREPARRSDAKQDGNRNPHRLSHGPMRNAACPSSTSTRPR